jgi:hypothetical protein
MKRRVGPAAVPAAMVFLAGLTLLVCTPSPPGPTASLRQPTLAHMTPPVEAAEFFAGGSSTPDLAREQLKTANWFGNEAIWVVLPLHGEIVGRLDDKIAPYRTKRGHVEYEARRLDGPGTPGRHPIGVDAYGDIGFAAGGPAFPSTGYWEVTYTLDGQYPLRFVLRVR